MFGITVFLYLYLCLTFQPCVTPDLGLKTPSETEHPVGYLLMHVSYSWRQADVHRLKEFALVALLEDVMK